MRMYIKLTVRCGNLSRTVYRWMTTAQLNAAILSYSYLKGWGVEVERLR